MAKTGEKVENGTYVCKNCGEEIHVEKKDSTLPPCASCNKTAFDKK